MIEFFYENVEEFEIPARFLNWVQEVISSFELNYIFCNDDCILDINRKYLKHDYYTDIITFDLSEKGANSIAADIFISIETVKSNAEENNVDFDNELIRVMSHGILHLIGFNDKTEQEKEEMRGEENKAIDFVLNNVSRETI